MTPLPLAPATVLLLLLALPGAAQRRTADAPAGGTTTVRAEVRIQRMVVRVPRTPNVPASLSAMRALPPIQWVERRTDRCVPIQNLAAVSISRTDSVDLLLNGGRRLRARLSDDCPSLDFYSGMYLRQTSDGNICASRDTIRSRSGGQCRIKAFRALVPVR